jgi:hypothetical protein
MLIIQHGCNLDIQFILLCFHGYHLSWHPSKYTLFQIINTTILNDIIVQLYKIDVFILHNVSICIHKEKISIFLQNLINKKVLIDLKSIQVLANLKNK